MVLVSGLSPFITDSEIRRFCLEHFGRPKYLYMHVGDTKTGLFSGTCVIEFSEATLAEKAIRVGVCSCVGRAVNSAEFDSLTSGEWPMVEYGPPRGVFSSTSESVQPAHRPVTAPIPNWASAPRPSNPWQK